MVGKPTETRRSTCDVIVTILDENDNAVSEIQRKTSHSPQFTFSFLLKNFFFVFLISFYSPHFHKNPIQL